MDREEVNQLFKNYYVYKDRIKTLKDAVERLETQATKVTPSYDPNKGGVPKNNPKSSKIEKNAVKIADIQKNIDRLQRYIDVADTVLMRIKPHNRYMIKCIISNNMSYEEFAKRAGIQKQTVRNNMEKIYKRLEDV